MIAVEFQGVTKRFGEVEAVAGVDLTIAKGERISIIGRSGSGKSTFLHVLGTLDYPSFGRVSYSGRDIFSLAPAELAAFRNRTIGFVFQFHHLLPDFSALENVMMPGLIQRRPTAEAEASARKMLDIVGLGHRVSHRPGELSGGEQQRVAIARALVKRPPLMLCDEPTGALDLQTGILTLQALLDANRRFGTTMLIVTHNADIARIADRVIHFADGGIRSITTNPERLDPAQLHW